jgi:uracil-DNA glycosylase
MKDLLERIAAEARKGDMDVDSAVYTESCCDPSVPVLLGSGSLASRIGFFGRDPGRREVELGEPFIGAGGQLVRESLFRALEAHRNTGIHQTHPDTGSETRTASGPLTLEESIEAGRHVFWGNTVPYKPTGNKAWSTAVKRRFVPFIRELLVEHWQGSELITLGNQAFDWFGLADPTLRTVLKAFWQRDDRYEASLEIQLDRKTFQLYPLPHPSPLNARWHRLFPGLLDRRLQELKWPS